MSSSNAIPVVLKEGFLSKRSRGASVLPRFQRRYFRLIPGELQYFYTPQDPVPRRRVALRLDSKVTATNDQGYDRCFAIKATPTTETFYVQADKDDEKDDWVNAIYNALRRTDDVASPEPSVASPSPSPQAQPQQPPARVLLHMNVVEAKGLKGVDLNGKSDPFCVVNLVGKDGQLIRSEEMKTNYVTDTLDPVWNQHFVLGKAVDLSTVEAIHFELWDHDHMMKNEVIGFVRVPLSMFQMSPASTGQSELVDRWFRVEPPPQTTGAVKSAFSFATGGPSSRRNEKTEQDIMLKHYGDLHLVMSVTGPNLVKFFQSMSISIAPQSRIVVAGIDHTDNRLEVTVLGAKDLIAADFNKSSDPFVELTLLDDKGKPIRGEFYRTAVKEKTRHPAWEDEHYIFGRICRIDEAAQLRVRVLDWDEHSKNDPLGGVLIDLDHLSAHNQTEWYALQPEQGMAIRENLGSIQLSIALSGETRGERKRRLQIDKEVASKTHELSVEQLELENATHQLHEAACRLDGARIACAMDDYQAHHPQFYGINGCIHHLNTQLPRAHRDTVSTDEGFQARSGIEGQAVLDITVLGTFELKKASVTTTVAPFAIIEMDPFVCIEECKRVSAPLSPQKSKRIQAMNSAASDTRNKMFSKRAQGEVSSHRTKLGKNEVRSEKRLDLSPDQPMLKVEIKSGHGLSGVDFGGYSDPYCTLSLTDRETGKPVEAEKKRTSVIQKTLNPVWESEVFFLGHYFPLSNAATLLIHVKDHNMTRSTPLGRVQIPISDLCHASASSTSITSTAREKRYPLAPEPWMKKHAQNLGELCIKTEVIGDATVLAEMLQRSAGDESPGKMLSFLSMQSFGSDPHLSEAGLSSLSLSSNPLDEDETTQIIEKGQKIKTATAVGASATWRKEKFTLSLSYPGIFSASKGDGDQHLLRLRVFGARELLGMNPTSHTGGNKKSHNQRHLLGRRAATNAYFTVIPVLNNGMLEHSERKQSLTVYGTRNPNWPDQEFVFGNVRKLEQMTYLSLHVYARDLDSDATRPLVELLQEKERSQVALLKRFHLRKIGATGVVDDDGLETLAFDQRVLAYRKCDQGGRFFPARVQKYRPLPHDDFVVMYEDGIESIDDLWDLLSVDVKGKIESIHANGTVDVSLMTEKGTYDAVNYARNVPLSLLTPVDEFTSSIESVMARRMDETKEMKHQWHTLQHAMTGLKVDVLSATGLPKNVAKPKCTITFLGNPEASPTQEVCTIGEMGRLVSKKALPPLTDKKEVLAFTIGYDGEAEDVHDQKRFEEKALVLGLRGDADGNEIDVPIEERMVAMEGKNVLMQTASLWIEVVDSVSSKTVGHARIDLASLHAGNQDLTVKLLPPPDVDYYKFVGTLAVHITCTASATAKPTQLAQPVAAGSVRKLNTVCGAIKWYGDRAKNESQSSATLSKIGSPRQSKAMTRIGRRNLLRSSLTPTENAQVDAFHTVLVVIMKRVVSILKEIQLLEEFENLAVDEMAKFRHVHTVNANMNSEWIGRPINEMSVETRKTITVELEMELLDIAASDWKRVVPSSGISREEWVQMRTIRQRELQKAGGFFMQDRTSAIVLTLPCCFTGEGMVAWICRAPAVLWKDEWVKYCHDARTKETCKLNWTDAKHDPDAMEAPRTADKVLMWLSTLSDAGFVENVSPSLSTLDANKMYYLVESKPDRFYRLREVERWLRKEKRGESLFPLDLVPEVDCYQQVDVVPVTSSAPPAAPASPKNKGAAVAPPSPAVVISKTDILAAQKRTYAKKLVEHVEGHLGLQNGFSGLLFSHEVQQSSLLKPVAAKTQQLVADKLLWDWKYCLFIPTAKSLYVYESDFSMAPTIIFDLGSTVCHAAYNFAYDKSGGWFNVVNATVLQASAPGVSGKKYTPISDELRDKLMKVNHDGSLAFEFKTPNAQQWVQSFIRAGVRVDMKPEQLVVLKRLNAAVLQQKCIEHVASFNPNDLEGSFQRLLNRFFKHDVELSHLDHEKKMRGLRASVRSEMKKSGSIGDPVMAYFGKGQRLNPAPTNERLFTRGALYSGRIVRIRSPFTDGKYRFTQTYDIKDAPAPMQTLLAQYKVKDKESWLQLPKWKRDIFLLYDVEYRHAHEVICEEDMLREHVRTNDGDLDATKVQERCTDLNLWFKPSDLEDCVTRMVIHTAGRKPLGCLKIPVKAVSPHRVMDVWYPLAPENEMVQKAKLGQIRVQLRLVSVQKTVRSKKVPAILLDDVKEAAAIAAAAKPVAQALTALNNPLKVLKDKLAKTAKRPPMSPTTASAFVVSRERSFITIRILEGRKMIPADILTSDPFVKIVLVREKDEKEEYTKLKTDIKYKTLSPKWQNQEFVLGKSQETMLSDKKAVILRVMDHDLTSADDPMGYLKLEFQRDKSGYITGLVLVHADEKGNAASSMLHLNDQLRVEVDEKVLADEKAGQSKSASARGNNASVDGKLGKLRFIVEIKQNENFVDPAGVSAAQMTTIMRGLETKFSLEVGFKEVGLQGKSATTTAPPDWKHFSCVFHPKGDGGQRIHYDIHTEDLGNNNTLKFGELLASSSSSVPAQPKILGRTYDMSRIAYFDVELRHVTTGKVFSGRFGEQLRLKDPRQCNALTNEVVVLKDKDDKELEVKLTLGIRVVAIHRAHRLKRLLAETFRIVGLDFDVRRINEERSAPGSGDKDAVQRFLWEVCKAHFVPGRNTNQELLAQVHRMCQSTKLHWKYTPQLLGMILEHVFSFGDKDRLSYDDAVALDAIMTRWSSVLQHLNEAKTQLVGHLHGKETPRLVHTLMSECDWTGFELASLPSAASAATEGHEESRMQESVLQVGAKVHALLPARKHAGVAVDVRLTSGQYVAGTIIAEYVMDDCFDVAFCTSAKVHEDDDGYFSDEEELPPLIIGQSIFVCPIAHGDATATMPVDLTASHDKPRRIGRVTAIDEVGHPKDPYLVEFNDGQEPKEMRAPRVWLDSMFPRVAGEDLSPQMAKDDFVRVIQRSNADSVAQGSRPARIVKNHRNGKYDVKYLDGYVDAGTAAAAHGAPVDEATTRTTTSSIETDVPRARLELVTERMLYDAKILRTYIAPASSKGGLSASYVVLYDLELTNGDFVEGVVREQLRQHEEVFPSDKCVLASVFTPKIEIQDKAEQETDVSKRITELFAYDQLVKVYVMMATQPTQILLRDSTTNKLLQAKLKVRDPAQPRFVEQCHGYSTAFTKEEEVQMKQIFETSAVLRGDAATLADPDAFDAKKGFCLYLAPQPRVELHGMLRVSPESNAASWALFKSLASLAAKNKQGLLSLFQSLFRSTASEHMPLNRKERVVVMKSVDVVDGQQLNVVFEIGVPHNSRGSLEYAVSVAHHDAAHILDRLMRFKWLAAYGEEDVAEKLEWVLHNDKENENQPALRVQILDTKGKDQSQPSLTMELLPLDDQRLSVVDASGKVWDICLPMDRVLVEAQLRRHLVPLVEAQVGDVVNVDDPSEEQAPVQQQINRRKRRDSVLLSKPTESLKIKRNESVGREFHVCFKKGSGTVKIPEHDIKFDKLRVLVKQASQLKLSEKMGAGDFTVEILLHSSDFQPQEDGDLALQTPFGVVLSENGEITKDFADVQYPKNSVQPLFKEVGSTDWKQGKGQEWTVFGQPGIDLDRVSGVSVKVWSKERKDLIGSTFIPMSAIPVTKTTQTGDTSSGGSRAKKNAFSRLMSAPGKTDSGTSSLQPSNEQTFGLYRIENGEKEPVGKITLSLERNQSVHKNDTVLAKRLITDEDAWKISDYELLALTLKQHEDQLMRGLLATSTIVPHGGLRLLSDPIDRELQLQKIANVMLISHAMERIYATKRDAASTPALAFKDGSVPLSSPRMVDQMKRMLTQTKWLIEDTAAEFGIRTTGKRLPWSSNAMAAEEEAAKRADRQFVVVHANVSNTAVRVRRTMLKLYQMYRHRLIPTLQRLYELDAMGDHIDIKAGEQLLSFFEEEVEDLDFEDQRVYRRVYQRIRVIKIAQVLQEIMRASLTVVVMNQDQGLGEDEIGTASIPLIDLLDRVEHDNYYELTKTVKRLGGGGLTGRPGSPNSQVYNPPTPQGKVHLRLQLSYSESSLLEQATTIYKLLKDKFIAQHDVARRRINAAVVPAQRRRWMTIKGYLDELKAQASGKLHWERTPVLLNLVWDIFLSHDSATKKSRDDEEEKHIEGLAERASEYRSAVVDVHKRWTNVQPLLEELLQIQAATQIHAQRTPELLAIIEQQVEGLDLVLSTAWQQVHQKWTDLENALEELVRMKERNKLHLSRAPQLLKKVTTRCSKGLNQVHADAVSTVQFRWMAITQKDGPLNELRLTEKKGLHWRRTHELVLLLNEQCEGFAEVDAKTLEIVQKRWQQLQEWLDDVVQMQVQHTIDCEATPFILKKMHLLESRHSVNASMKTSSHAVALKKRVVSPPSSPKMARSPSTRASDRRLTETSPSSRAMPSPLPGGQSFSNLGDVELDVDRLEGLAEWYAIEETKRELERIPLHRITTDYDRNNRLMYSQDGKDTRLLITQEEIVCTARNVRAALVDRGVIPLMASFVDLSDAAPPVVASATSPTKATGLPKELMEEIHLLEQSIEAMQLETNGSSSASSLYVKWNPERVAELYLVIESLGKSDLLWKIDHAVNTNRELEIPNDYRKLLIEMKLRQIPTTEIEELVTTLLVNLQKEELSKMGVEVPPTANFTAVLALMHRHQVKDVVLPFETTEIQRMMQERGLDKRGEPVFLRGMRIGTQTWNPDEGAHATASVTSKAAMAKINTGLGVVDGKIEQLRKSLLMEALRKRNSLIKTFPGESYILTPEELAECTEVDMSGDYRTLIERFQQLLIHESHTKRLAEYAAMDRCMRALLRVPADQIVTKEDIAKSLQPLGSRHRLPLEAFTREELLAAASQGKIRTPTEAMLARCPMGKNAKAMSYYAAVSHAALVFQETVRFRARLDPMNAHRFVDAFPFETTSSVDGMSVPKNRSRMSFKEYVVDWLLGTEESVVKIQRRLGAYHRQRLEWASAAFTLRNRWYQRGFGWCDGGSGTNSSSSTSVKCAGAKVLLQKLLLFENANKMHMVDTEALLSDVNDKCVNLRARERQAKELLEQRYADNFAKLETLVIHAEKCMNNRKLHAEETPALLHAIEQACVVPHGLHALHRQAHHVVSSHWTRHRARLAELVHMHKQGTFSIERTPELLSAMEFHTEGIAGADELTIDRVLATASASTTPLDMQQRYVDRKEDEIRRGQRKQASTLRLNLEHANSDKDLVLEELKESDEFEDNNSSSGVGNVNQWQSLSPSKRIVQPLSPRDKQTSWKVVTSAGSSSSSSSIPGHALNTSGSSSSPTPSSLTKQSIVLENKAAMLAGDRPRRKSSIGEDIKELLRSPSKWLMATTEPQDSIRPEIFFPRELCIDLSQATTTADTSTAAGSSAPAAPVATPAEG